MSTLMELEVEQVSVLLLEILRRQGMHDLTMFQRAAVKEGILKNTNLTLVTQDYDEAYQISEVALLNQVASDLRSRVLILCPNPHVAEMRIRSLGYKCARLGVDVSSIVRKSVSSFPMPASRVTVATFRSMEAAARLHPKILDGLSRVYIERIDLVGQTDVGPALERLMTLLLTSSSSTQLISVTPRVANLDELAGWLRSRIVVDPRPEVRRIFSVKAYEQMDRAVAELADFVCRRGGQSLILCPNMSSSESLAAHLSGSNSSVALSSLTADQRSTLRALAEKVQKSFPQCSVTHRLADCIRKGVAFIHEGLPKYQRQVLSGAWNAGVMPVLVVPSRFVLASELRATAVFVMGVYSQDISSEISGRGDMYMLSEWQLAEMLQLAGRPGRDTEAYGTVIVDSDSEKARVVERFFETDSSGSLRPVPSEIDSLLDEPDHVQDLILGQVCGRSEYGSDPLAMLDNTFWAFRMRTVRSRMSSDKSPEDEEAWALIHQRTTRSTIDRARRVSDKSVRLVSVSPTKIEGLVHSGSRELWHYAALRTSDGASCSCESWKYQGVRRHRLCKHLAKLAMYSLSQAESRPYAASIIRRSLQGLGALESLEQQGFVNRDGSAILCTTLGRRTAMMGVPLREAKIMIDMTSGRRGDLVEAISQVAIANTGLPASLVKQVVKSVRQKNDESLISCDDLPGIVENILEELHYVAGLLVRIVGDEQYEDGLTPRDMEDAIGRLLASLRK